MNNDWHSPDADVLSAAAPSAAYADHTPTFSHVGGFGFEKPNTGETNNWLTPLGLLQRLGIFDLDPCGCAGMPWQTDTTTYFLPEKDGLIESWHGRVCCNPPYGHGAEEPWLKRMEQHGNGMLLIFGPTDTQAWQKSVFPHADALLFVEGRVQFPLAKWTTGEIRHHTISVIGIRREQRRYIAQCRHRWGALSEG